MTATSASNTGRDKPKPKLSKSRNGCVTCKAKRLKCDEVKPTCLQCQKRNVECGGYKRDFKWRLFEEPSLTKRRPKATSANSDASLSSASSTASPSSQRLSSADSLPWFALQQAVSPSTFNNQINFAEFTNTPPNAGQISDIEGITAVLVTSPATTNSTPTVSNLPTPSLLNDVVVGIEASEFDSKTPREVTKEENDDDLPQLPLASYVAYPRTGFLTDETEDAKSVNVGPNNALVNPQGHQQAIMTLLPSLDAHTRTALFFHTNTCSVMSIIDTPFENPWRSLFWPLAQTHKALYHGVAAMANFHAAATHPAFRVEAVDHMRIAIHELVHGLNNNMPSDVALATTIALAFSEAWDRHISTGVAHLRGARILIRQFVSSRLLLSSASQKTPTEQARLSRFRTLFNAWKYIAVITRLVSDDDTDGTVEERQEEQSVFDLEKSNDNADPLMGFATTLFPLIGEVASLVRRVRLSGRDDLYVASALELKKELESWMPSARAPYIVSDDPCFDSGSCLATAHAYKYATLLYLFQCVPSLAAEVDITKESWANEVLVIEGLAIPDQMRWSEGPESAVSLLAAKVLNLLSAIPTTSRTCVVHILPLLSAACEVDSEPLRDLARTRWLALARMLNMGNVDRALDVVEEVWRRKTAHNGKHRYKVGLTHWTTVMREWGWELLLG
ncbi:fungal-specific transcription factor domain-containing protein [Lipomyces arxii]|uniref:fungal-specific transcription factor domain-containing protein n=1 Tax=Lipomyces arxii TaxID=56418 RepID=UPI0034CF37CD